MKYWIRLFSTFLSLSIILVALPLQGLASEHQESPHTPNVLAVTTEPSMPTIPITRTGIAENTLNLPQRAAWVEQTTAILENAYGQEVLYVEEDADYIRFHFETEEYDIDPQEAELTPWQMLKTEYIKPESSLSNGYSTKISYFYAWDTSFKNVDNKSAANMISASSLIITLCGGLTSPLSTLITTVASAFNAAVENSKSVQGYTQAKYYYQNKAGCVQTSVGYIPVVYVGCRRGFVSRRAIFTHSGSGEPLDRTKPAPDADNTYDPRNFDKQQDKTNFANNSWITSEAVRRYTNNLGTYMDVFKFSSTPIPGK